MSVKGPIVIIDHDTDDVDIIKELMASLDYRGKIIVLESYQDAFEFLCTMSPPPSLIICEVRLLGHNGLYLKRQLDEVPDWPCSKVPFVFMTAYVDEETHEITLALTSMFVRTKPASYDKYLKMVNNLLEVARKHESLNET